MSVEPSLESSETLLVVGASHRTVEVATLNGFAQGLVRMQTELQRSGYASFPFPVRELGFLSTCNRVEVYAVTGTGREDEVLGEIRLKLFPSPDHDGCEIYQLRGTDAVRHLCRVAAGLESMVVGEHQIAGQVARAFRDSIHMDGGGRTLASVASLAREASRRVRAETELGHHSVSIASVAIDLIKTHLGTLEGRRGIVVGAGRVGKLVSTLLTGAGITDLTILNRSLDPRRSLADRLSCKMAPLDRLPELLREADVVITATASPTVMLDEATVEEAVAERNRERPLCIVDLALPSDVDPKVAALPNVRLLDLADVQRQLEQNVSLRMQAVGPAEAVVEEVVRSYESRSSHGEVERLITNLRREAEHIRSVEVTRWLESQNGGGAPSQDELDRLTRSIVSKLLHDPMIRLRAARGSAGMGEPIIQAARELFGVLAREDTPPSR